MVARTRCGEEGAEQDRDMPREVEGICSFIQEHYQKRLTLDTIASEAGFSKYYVKPPFQAVYGNHGGGLPDSDPDEEGKGTAEKRDLQHQADKRYGGIFGAELLHMDI